MKDKKDERFPDKKDLTYWILILLILFTVVATWKTEDPGRLSAELALGGTILSILLGVVAIIFSFIQSSSSSRQSEKLIDRIAKMTSTVESLSRVSDSLENVNKQQIGKIENIENKLQSYLKEIGTKLSASNEKFDFSEIEQVVEKINKLKESDLDSGLVIFGPQALLNTIKNLVGEDKTIHIQVLWMNLFENGVRIEINELEEVLKGLEKSRHIELIKSDDQLFVKLAESK
ncbi:hypothetical protein [Paenibacillus xylanivorans]|uniref:Uncharacterized protein n=1 Tax=Paenibacillus xylanivorans TaxID=1705561 RepID=A0A0M9BI06_9BACL|nr:hypothetical protein [Paenibacillus xylanivorans]KOY12740.1 hypothetical protein AMS66_30580 [Paenibacillus xylanivorans]